MPGKLVSVDMHLPTENAGGRKAKNCMLTRFTSTLFVYFASVSDLLQDASWCACGDSEPSRN